MRSQINNLRYTDPSPVTIGLRAKTGRAIVVVVGRTRDAPVILYKGEIKLVDPKVPETAQPYHAVMDLRWNESERAVQKFARAIQRVATKALSKLIKEQAERELRVQAVATVGAKDRDLARIGNPHIRAHAAEGVLFPSRTRRSRERKRITSADVCGTRVRTDHQTATGIEINLSKEEAGRSRARTPATLASR